MSTIPIEIEAEDLDPDLAPEGAEGLITIQIPAKWEVCGRCGGEGKHDDSRFFNDGGGITASEWAELCHDDEDFAQDYANDRYSCTCEVCRGRTTVLVIDHKAIEEASEPNKSLWEEALAMQVASAEAAAEYAAEVAAERRYFGG